MVTHYRSRDLGFVVESINADDDPLCVDFFQRPDKTYGYEEYRRDVETGEGWFPIGFHSSRVFEQLADAQRDAAQCVAWLSIGTS